MRLIRIVLIFFGLPLLDTLTGCAKISPTEYPTYVDRITPGIFLEETKATLKPGLSMRKVHPKGLALTKVSEGFIDHLYNDPVGYCTVAYGHLIKKARCNGTEPRKFQGKVPEPFGAEVLQGDMAGAEIVVLNALADRLELNDGEFAALADFAFNVGPGNFQNSTLLKRVRARKYDQIPFEFRKWTMASGQILPGLVQRREKEIALFFDESRAEISEARPTANETIDIRVGEQPM